MDSMKVTEDPTIQHGAMALGDGFNINHIQGSKVDKISWNDDPSFKSHSGIEEYLHSEAKSARAKGEVPMYASESTSDTIIHEIAHNIQRKMGSDDFKKWNDIYERHRDKIDNLPSYYAQENDSEMWAESVLAVVRSYPFGGTTSGYSQPDKEIESFVRSYLGVK